ncbi:DUF2225 domain-containing protein, partial [Tyzzerella sp. OttesenSCG-928-J15]|nr:DUF2225 domain-containing protein [Tyzzerella sp. OttesenSCG-928-J15]
KGFIRLQLSWLYREKGDEDNESAFRDGAIKNFTHAYENERFPMAGFDSPTLTYLLGDLYRRSGKYDDALKFISQVVVMRDIPARLKERAVDVKDLIAKERGQES